MSIEGKLTAGEIVSESGMCKRPEFYSGRGPILGDLNPNILGKVYGLIGKEHGEDAAENFIDMVANMEDLAATNFLTCLYLLESNGWEYSGFQSDLPIGVTVPQDGNREHDPRIGVINVLGATNRRDETESIREPFLREHGKDEPKTSHSGNCFSNDIIDFFD
jgi:hypothetical protein